MNEEIKFKDLLESFPENTKRKEESIKSLISPSKAVITDADAGITIYSKRNVRVLPVQESCSISAIMFMHQHWTETRKSCIRLSKRMDMAIWW